MRTDKQNNTGSSIRAIVGENNTTDDLFSSFSEMMELLSDGVFFLNMHWEFTYLNSAAVDYMGKSRSDLIGNEIWDQFPELVRTFFYEGFHHALMNGKPVEFDEYYSINDTWFHVKAYPEKTGLLVIFQDITQKHLAMEVVEESYRTLFQKHPEAVCSIDLDGNILAINSAFKKLFPFDEKLYLGSNYEEFVPPAYKEEMEGLFKYAVNGKPQTTEINCSKEMGSPFHIMLTTIPIIVHSNIIGVYGIIKDITSEKESLKKYLDISRMNELILDSVDEGIAGFDKQFNVVMWNPAAEKMTGYLKNELSEETLRRIFNISGQNNEDVITSLFPDIVELSKDTIIRQSDVTILRKDGTPLITEFVLTPMIKDGETLGVVYTFRDITEKKKSEELLYQSEKLSAVGQLAAGIAHEIRNPLTSLKGFLQLIQISGESKEEYFEIMNSEFGRIEQILNELLVLSKPQTSEKDTCQLNSLITHIVTLLNTQAIIKNIYISKQDNCGPLYIQCISNQIKQVFINFIKNAIEAMDGGEIKVQLCENNGFAVVKIIDEGCGIPDSLLKRVGEPFFTTKEKGTGLGLMVSYQIIEDHGGEVQVESKEGEGTTFTVTLPLKETLEK